MPHAWFYAYLLWLSWFLKQCEPPLQKPGVWRGVMDEDGRGTAEGIREERETDQTEGRKGKR